MTRPILLDLFCGAGGAAVGYHRAGFDVIGVDIAPQPNYPFEFHQADALEVLALMTTWRSLEDTRAIHASPPCQLHSTQKTGVTGNYQDLIAPVRDLLIATGLPYVIENVVGAPLIDPLKLCGTSFGCIIEDAPPHPAGCDLQRHRLFESNLTLSGPPCAHSKQRRTLGVYGNAGHHDSPNRPSPPAASHRGWKAGKQRARDLMGVDWEVTDRELAESIPPAFTHHIGLQMIEQLTT